MKTALVIIYILLAGLIVLVFLQNQRINKLKRELIKGNQGNAGGGQRNDFMSAGEFIRMIKEKLDAKNFIEIN